MGPLSAGVRQLPYQVEMVAQRGFDVHVRRPRARESREAAPRVSTYPFERDPACMAETILPQSTRSKRQSSRNNLL